MEEDIFEKKPLINENGFYPLSIEKENPFLKKELDKDNGFIKKFKETEKKKIANSKKEK